MTSVAAIGGLSAIGAGPASELTGDGLSLGARVAPAAVVTEQAVVADVGGAAGAPFTVLDPAPAFGGVRPVEPDALTLLGSAEELASSDEGGVGRAAIGAAFDTLDPAEFVAFDAEPAAEDEAPEEAGAEQTAEETPLVYEGADGETIDPERIRAWLAGRNYPLADYAEELVAAGIDHGVDPRLIVGIAVIESSGGKHLPPSTHNAWGWSGNGPHGLKSWPSWPEAIDGFTEGLARVYDTDTVDERMARKYVPPNWEKWLRTVRWVINDI